MIPGWAALGAGLRALLNSHGLAIIGLVIFLEELGIPIPVPGDLMMLLGGIRVAHGREALWTVLLVEELATLAGATALFVISRHFGHSLVARYGRFVHLGPAQLERAESTVRRHGGRAIIVARLVPGLRIITVVAAGVLKVPLRVFVPALALGGFLYLLTYTLLGLFVGPLVLSFLERLALPVSALLSLAGLAVLIVVVRAAEREQPPRAAGIQVRIGSSLLAGLVAGLAGLLMANGVLGIVSFFGQLLGQTIPLAATQVTNELRLLFGWPIFLATAVLLGALYALLRLRRLPWLPRLLLVAGIPLALTLLLVDPLTDQSATLEMTGASSAVIAAVATIRWLGFGVALDRVVPLTARLRQPEPERWP